MSGPPAPPAPHGVARSKLILATGSAASASILAVWLLVWLIFFQTHLRILAFASDLVGPSVPLALTFQHADAKDATARNTTGELRPLPASNASTLIPTIAAYLAEHRGQTSIVYLASPALGSLGDSPGIVLAPVDVLRHVVKDRELPGTTLAELLNVFKQARGQRLLILDIGRSAADTDPGAVGDDILATLEQLARPPARSETEKYAAWQRDWAGFVILCSTAAGQWAWTSDADGRSVFGHFVADGLRRGGEVSDLLRNVPAQVAHWVAEQRGGAVQTPIVLGDRTVSFHLPASQDRLTAEPDPRQGDLARSIRDRLARHYQRHAAYERGGLPGLDPIGWRDYRQAWLLAERLFRAGQISASGQMLAVADAKETPFKTPGEHDWPSLALALAVLTDRDRRAPLLALGEAPGGTTAPGPPPAPRPTTGAALRTLDDFAESQPGRWLRNYDEALRAVGRGPDPSRVPLLDQALRVRRLAEQATAAAPGGHPWIDRLTVEADTQRRDALDTLCSEANRATVAPLLGAAEAKYTAALQVAEALNLANQVAADLPFLGAWLVQSQQPDDDRLIRIAEKTRTLTESLVRGRTDPGEPPIAQIKEETATLARDFAPLRKRFADAATQASQSGSSRDLDAILAVPSVDPVLREALVTRAIDPATIALRAPAEPRGEVKESAGMGLVRQGINSTVTVRDLGRQGYDALSERSRSVAAVGPAPEVRPDPSFAPHQIGLARLEWCLLTIGGLSDKATLPGLLNPPETGAGIAALVRQARTRLLRQVEAGPGSDPSTLAAWERARLALPASSRDEPAGDPGATRWGRLVLRLAETLRLDGDARLARQCLDGLPDGDRTTEEARRIAQGIAALGRPIRLDYRLDGSLVLDSGLAAPLRFVIQAPADSPAGQAALLLGSGGDLRLGAAEPHDLIAVGTTPGPVTAPPVEVRRHDLLGQSPAQASVRAIVAYRGQRSDPATVGFELPVVPADLEVRFSTRYLANHRAELVRHYHIDGKFVVDQFQGRPDEYFLYRGAETALDASVRSLPRTSTDHPGPRRIIASASFDGKPLAVTLKDAKGPSGPVEIKEGQELMFEVGAIDTSDPKFRTPADGSRFRFEVKTESGDSLLQQEVLFREIGPEAQYVATAQRTAPNEVAVTVRRGDGDPIAIVTRVVASVGGSQTQLHSIQYEKMTRLTRDLGDRVEGGKALRREAILVHGESATFLFHVAPQENLTLKAEVLNTPGRPPWPLAVTPNMIAAAPLPKANRPARATNPDDPGADNPAP